MVKQTVSTDVVIIGAGIAGLWLHNRLNSMGFHSLLLENDTIGNAQTLSSQGIIHGGAKYALNGILSKATQAIGDMPARWQACLKGQGDVDLSGVRVLADHQLMWSKDQLSSKMLSFFASKALASRMQPVAKSERPTLFQHTGFKGALYQLDEPVLDVTTVLQCLAKPYQNRIVSYPKDWETTWQRDAKNIQSIQLGDEIEIKAQHFVLTAGEGTESLLHSLDITKPSYADAARYKWHSVKQKTPLSLYPLSMLIALAQVQNLSQQSRVTLTKTIIRFGISVVTLPKMALENRYPS